MSYYEPWKRCRPKLRACAIQQAGDTEHFSVQKFGMDSVAENWRPASPAEKLDLNTSKKCWFQLVLFLVVCNVKD